MFVRSGADGLCKPWRPAVSALNESIAVTVMDEPIPSQKEEDDADDLLDLEAEVLERQRLFGEKLRSLYNEVVQEPTPDSFIALLDELAAKESGG